MGDGNRKLQNYFRYVEIILAINYNRSERDWNRGEKCVREGREPYR